MGTAVLGAGPAGLTAAYVLGLRGAPAAVFEADGTVGGIAKTVEYDGYRFDLGGHRFFTKLAPSQRLWEEMLGDELLVAPAAVAHLLRRQVLRLPAAGAGRRRAARHRRVGAAARSPTSAARLAPAPPRARRRSRTGSTAASGDASTTRSSARTPRRCGASRARRSAPSGRRSGSRTSRSGRRCSPSLASQRRTSTTLIEEFHYPRLGPGQMWEAFQARVEERGVPVQLTTACVGDPPRARRRHRASSSQHDGRDEVRGRRASSRASRSASSSCPRPGRRPQEIVAAARAPALPRAVPRRARDRRRASRSRTTGSTCTTRASRAGRVQNFGAWSPDMVKPGTTCLGVEYFCFEGDEIWEMPDEEAVELATDELARIGLIDPEPVIDGVKVRVPQGLPDVRRRLPRGRAELRGFLAGFDNLKTFGRNGLHRYNNQDHSMWTAILATLNLVDGTAHDVWSVNTEDDTSRKARRSTRSSMSTSSADDPVPISVVVADNEAQRLVPELWRDGIDGGARRDRGSDDLADGPGPDWLDSARRCRQRPTRSAARSSRAPGCASRLGRVLLPLRARHAAVPGPRDARPAGRQRRLPAGCAHRDARRLSRRLLGAGRASARFADEGYRLWHSPGSSSTWGARPGSARSCASASSTGASSAAARRRLRTARNVAGVLAQSSCPSCCWRAPSRSRLTAAAAPAARRRAPLLLAFDVAWAAGEALGHLDALRGR